MAASGRFSLHGVRGGDPSVTASPCQPPLGKGAEGTGVADCHSQCTHWLRNDRVSMECGAWQAGDREGRPYGGLQGVPCGRADRSVRPYGWVIDGAVCGGTHGSRPTGHFCRAGPACPAVGAKKTRSGRCRHRPLRKRNKRCNGRATARVAPTKALQGVR